MFDRRTFLASSTALGLVSIAGMTPADAQTACAAANERDRALDSMLSGWFEEDLRQNPIFATGLGLDIGARAALRGQFGDASLRERERRRVQYAERARALAAFGGHGLSESGIVNRDILLFRYATQAEVARFRFGSHFSPFPYVVTQLGGSYQSTPDFMDRQHPVRTREDADAYLSRIEQWGSVLAQENEQVRADAALGVLPPDFVMDVVIGGLQRLRDTPAAETAMVRSIARRAGEAGLGDYATRATALVAGPVHAGLEAQLALLRELRPRATSEAGVWKLPDGAAYYQWAIKTHTTTAMSAADVHHMGVTQVAELQARLDGLLRAQGFTQGSVGARIGALNRQPDNVWPNTDAGRAELLASLNRQMEAIRPLLARAFATIPPTPLEIRRVPPAIEQGAGGGYAQPAPFDGSRPSAYYINLRDTAEWPKHTLPTLGYHEGLPGHVFQGVIARQAGEVPIYRRSLGYTAYNEGWALYSERVADELGVYENDPLGRIGYLQAYLYRAARLVVDSGLHDQRWSRGQAIRYMVENGGLQEGSAQREVDRYCVLPGQACAYKIGQTVIANLRAEAERTMGPRFDIRAFHDVVLLSGAMPLNVLQRRVRVWMNESA